MKTFFQKVLHDSLSRTVAALAVAALALFFPSVRRFLAAFLEPVEVPGLVLLAAFLCAAAGLAYFLKDRIGPAYQRKYRKEEIDGIVWRWSYKDGAVSNLRAFCAKPGCDTELMLTPDEGSFDSGVRSFRGTKIFCTSCNKGWGISNAMDLPDHERRKIEKRIRDDSWKALSKK